MKGNSRFVIYILIVLITLLALGYAQHKQTEHSGIYHEPGVCEYCGTKLQKTAIGRYGSSDYVVWYCPNPDCAY